MKTLRLESEGAYRRAFLLILTVVYLLARCTEGKGQSVEFVSPFHVVVAPAQGDQKATTDMYHVPTRVVLSDSLTSIGTDVPGGRKFVQVVYAVEREPDGRTRYIVDEGIIVHETLPGWGGCLVRWITDKFVWALYEKVPDHIQVEN